MEKERKNRELNKREVVQKEVKSKEETKKEVVLSGEESVGMVQIADDVVAMIAALAATEVEGVNSMAGMKKLTKGVRVDVKEGRVRVDLAVTMEYGYNIPVTCKLVQGKVKAAIENMTGLTCSDVNIRIAGVRVR